MMNRLALVAVLFVVILAGCNATGETKVAGGGVPVADQLKVDPNWEAEPVRDWQVMTRPEKSAESTKPNMPETEPGTMPKVQMEKVVEVDKPAETTPEDLTDRGAETAMDASPLTGADPEMATLVVAEHGAVRELATLGAKRCMACDDVSDLNQCVTCGHHHKKSMACPSEHLNSRCEACYGKKGETVVVYPADAPCGACGQVHEGVHCPHCEKSENKK